MIFNMRLGRFGSVVHCMLVVPVGQVRVMPCRLVSPRFVMFGGLLVMACRMFVMLCCFVMVLDCLL